MPVCLKCGWEILIGPGGCACTRVAKHKKAMENAARSGERIEQMMKVVDLGFTIKNDPEAPVRVEDHRKGVPEKDRVRILKIKPEKKEKRGTGLERLSADTRRLSIERRGFQVMARSMLWIDPKGIGFAMGEGRYLRAGGDVECPDCGMAYVEHPELAGYPTFHVICTGGIVKL